MSYWHFMYSYVFVCRHEHDFADRRRVFLPLYQHQPYKLTESAGLAMSNTPWNAHLYQDKHAFVWKMGVPLLELLNPQAGERILDVGCGTGQLAAQIAQTGATVVGLDLDEAMLEQARSNYPTSSSYRATPPVFTSQSCSTQCFPTPLYTGCWMPRAPCARWPRPSNREAV